MSLDFKTDHDLSEITEEIREMSDREAWEAFGEEMQDQADSATQWDYSHTGFVLSFSGWRYERDGLQAAIHVASRQTGDDPDRLADLPHADLGDAYAVVESSNPVWVQDAREAVADAFQQAAE